VLFAVVLLLSTLARAETTTIMNSAPDPALSRPLVRGLYISLSLSLPLPCLSFDPVSVLLISFAHSDGIPLSSNAAWPSFSIPFFPALPPPLSLLFRPALDPLRRICGGRSREHFNLHYAPPRIAEGSIKFLLSEAAFSVPTGARRAIGARAIYREDYLHCPACRFCKLFIA
jgi:hypothetical protein